MTMKLSVGAEYGSSGIWRIEPDGVSMASHDEIHLLPELSQRFNEWIELYLSTLYANKRGEPEPVTLDQFNEIGRGLAKDLKTFMGPNVVVEFVSKLSSGIDGPPEPID